MTERVTSSRHRVPTLVAGIALIALGAWIVGSRTSSVGTHEQVCGEPRSSTGGESPGVDLRPTGLPPLPSSGQPEETKPGAEIAQFLRDGHPRELEAWLARLTVEESPGVFEKALGVLDEKRARSGHDLLLLGWVLVQAPWNAAQRIARLQAWMSPDDAPDWLMAVVDALEKAGARDDAFLQIAANERLPSLAACRAIRYVESVETLLQGLRTWPLDVAACALEEVRRNRARMGDRTAYEEAVRWALAAAVRTQSVGWDGAWLRFAAWVHQGDRLPLDVLDYIRARALEIRGEEDATLAEHLVAALEMAPAGSAWKALEPALDLGRADTAVEAVLWTLPASALALESAVERLSEHARTSELRAQAAEVLARMRAKSR